MQLNENENTPAHDDDDDQLAAMMDAITNGKPIPGGVAGSDDPSDDEEEGKQQESKPADQAPASDAQSGAQPQPPQDAPMDDDQQVSKLQQELDKITRRSQSDQGRINALRSKLEKLRTPAALDNPALASMAQEFPEIGRTIQQSLESTLAHVNNTVAEFIEPQIETAEQTRQEETLQALEVVRPGFKETVTSPEFQAWFTRQAPGIKALGESDNPHDALALVQGFDRMLAQSKQIDSLQQKRQQNLAAHTTTRNLSRTEAAANTPTSADDELEAMLSAIRSGKKITF